MAGLLADLAAHNAWANDKIFAACAQVPASRLAEPGDEYDSVMGILNHLVQVENAFLELAHGRTPDWDPIDEPAALRAECARIDAVYVEYAGSMEATDARTFLVPWFGFEITVAQGVVQPLTHSHKHRADVSMILPRLGGGGVEMDFIQWLDEERSAR